MNSTRFELRGAETPAGPGTILVVHAPGILLLLIRFLADATKNGTPNKTITWQTFPPPPTKATNNKSAWLPSRLYLQPSTPAAALIHILFLPTINPLTKVLNQREQYICHYVVFL